MSYSMEHSPIEYVTESCCICDEEFSSDSELSNHLVEHTNEIVFKEALEREAAKQNAANQQSTVKRFNTSELTKTTFVKGQSLRKSAARPSTPEVWEIVSDDSDDDKPDPNRKSQGLLNRSFRLVSSPNKPIPNGRNTIVNNAITNNAITNNGITNNAITNNGITNNAITNNGITNNAITNNAITNNGITNNAITNNAITNNAIMNNTIPNTNTAFIDNGPPYKCRLCPSSFTEIKAFREHLLNHDKPRPFTCEICNKSFAYKGTLRQHLHLHIGEKAHECKVCHKRFTLKSVLRKHEEGHDTELMRERARAATSRQLTRHKNN